MKLTTIVVTAALALSACGHGVASGTGKKIGQVLQIGQHGWMCSTYEGKLARGGLNGGSGAVGGVFDFTVEGEDLFRKLNDAMERQQEIEVSYQKVSFSGPCTSESDHFVTGFRVLQETQQIPTNRIDPEDARKQRIQELQDQIKSLQR